MIIRIDIIPLFCPVLFAECPILINPTFDPPDLYIISVQACRKAGRISGKEMSDLLAYRYERLNCFQGNCKEMILPLYKRTMQVYLAFFSRQGYNLSAITSISKSSEVSLSSLEKAPGFALKIIILKISFFANLIP
jgi:hypothetical protein